ncbi:MAG: transporter substrate-binding domain-containing protein [Methylococcales bacterium]
MRYLGASSILSLLITSNPLLANDRVQTLKVCLPVSSPPYSEIIDEIPTGFDVELSRKLAGKLKHKLEIVWFKSEDDDEAFYHYEVNGLLSSGACHVVAGFPLYRPLLDKPFVDKVRLPELYGEGRKPPVKVTTTGLVASIPYHFAPLTVLFSPSVKAIEITHLKDLNKFSIGSEEGTLADASLMMADKGKLVSQIHHFIPGKHILPSLESGSIDAVLIEQHRFDAYKKNHPDSQIKESAYVHPVGFNMGYVASKTQEVLVQKLNRVLSRMIASNAMKPLSDKVGMRYLEPKLPAIQSRLFPRILAN